MVEIEGRPVRQQVAPIDLQMQHLEAGENRATPTTTAHIHIANTGRTYSQVQGDLRVERRSREQWRYVTRVPIPERGIMPGARLELGNDLQRRLPSGTYRLRGELHVDGTRVQPLEKIIEFEGDPQIDTLAYDTALGLYPDMVQMEVAAGATRTAMLRIENPGDDPVRVRMGACTPAGLQGVAMGAVIGESLSAAPWTEIRPSEFIIRPSGRRNVRVITRLPRDGVEDANYYADLVLQGSYEDGQSAGETRSMVRLVNQRVESVPSGIIDGFRLAEGDEPSRYVVQARFANVGNIHLKPTAQVQLLTGRGANLLSRRLDGESGPLLPLGMRSFGAELDFSGISEDEYALRATRRASDSGGPCSGSRPAEGIVRRARSLFSGAAGRAGRRHHGPGRRR